MKNRMGTMVIALLLLGLQPSARAHQNDVAQASDPASSAKVPSDPVPTPRPSVPSDYRIGVSDVIAVSVWKVADLSRTVPVRPDGKISLPLIGDIEAAGKTTKELHDVVVAGLKPYVPDADVTVIVEQINSQKYFVLGQVVHPGSYPLIAPTTVIEALSGAGGFVDWAQTDKIMVVRHTASDQTERMRFNYKDWLKKKDKKEGPLRLQNGDVIVVP